MSCSKLYFLIAIMRVVFVVVVDAATQKKFAPTSAGTIDGSENVGWNVKMIRRTWKSFILYLPSSVVKLLHLPLPHTLVVFFMAIVECTLSLFHIYDKCTYTGSFNFLSLSHPSFLPPHPHPKHRILFFYFSRLSLCTTPISGCGRCNTSGLK